MRIAIRRSEDEHEWRPSEDQGVPEETREIAKAVFPKGNVYLWMRDELGALYRDDLFADLYSSRGQPTFSHARLVLVSVMQFMEGLTDRQAAEAVRARIDWKDALGMELVGQLGCGMPFLDQVKPGAKGPTHTGARAT